MEQIAEVQRVTLSPLDDHLSIYEIGFDSLVFAIVIARLEGDLAVTPSTTADGTAFPVTFGDFVQAYEFSEREVLALRDRLSPDCPLPGPEDPGPDGTRSPKAGRPKKISPRAWFERLNR